MKKIKLSQRGEYLLKLDELRGTKRQNSGNLFSYWWTWNQGPSLYNIYYAKFYTTSHC